ncbi:MAG: hypothetical protein HYV28_08250 [Ignavibacteriales bacterium]|nr:hypothetical protein [Ignavibacteriales bacterium]
MAKGGGSGAKMLYFVLYIVLIVELLIVITERDELEEVEAHIRTNMLGSIANSYKLPIQLSVTPKALDYNVGATENNDATVVLSVVGLVADEEKKEVKYHVDVDPSSKVPDGWPSGGVSTGDGTEKYKVLNDEQGNATFLAKINSEGDYKFIAQCQVDRKFPEYLHGTPLLDSLKVMVGNLTTAISNKDKFAISAKRQGGVKKAGAQIVF